MNVRTDKEFFVEKLMSTEREGISSLLEEMENIGFFKSPCSGGKHLCREGGLLRHSVNVMLTAENIARTLIPAQDFQKMHNSIIIAAGLHDLGKCGDFGKQFYVPNMIKDGRPTKANPEQKYKQSETKPFMRNTDLTNIPHSFRSAIIAERWINLTEEEEYAIMYHDGLYDRETGGYAVIPGHETMLLCIVHWADMWSAKFIEKEETEETESAT